MKNKLARLLIIFSLIIVSCNSEKQDEKSDLSELNIKGKINSLTEKTYEAIEKFGEISKGQLKNNDNSKIFFNKKGLITKELIFDKEGNAKGNRIIYSYDNNHNLIERKIIDSDGKVLHLTKNTFSDKNIKTESNHFDKNGKLIAQNKFQYDSEGNCTTIENYKPDLEMYLGKTIFKFEKNKNTEMIITDFNATPTSKEIYEYNENNNIIKIITSNFLIDDITQKTTDYDDYQNVIIEKYYTSNKLQYELSYKYEYNDKGNWTKRTEFKNGFPISIAERKYD